MRETYEQHRYVSRIQRMTGRGETASMSIPMINIIKTCKHRVCNENCLGEMEAPKDA